MRGGTAAVYMFALAVALNKYVWKKVRAAQFSFEEIFSDYNNNNKTTALT
jgi:hypothetical protein